MIRRISSLGLGLAVTLAAAGAFAQNAGGDAGGAAGGDQAAPAAGGDQAAPAAGGDQAAPAAGGDATPSGGDATAKAGASAGGDAAASSDGPMQKNALGVDAGLLIPIGNLGDATGLMIGGAVKYEMDMSPNLGLTGRVGYFYGLGKSVGPISVGISDLPVWVGARYYLMGNGQGLHAGAEVGLNYFMERTSSYSQTVGGTTITIPSTSTSKAYFGFNIPVGYKIGDLDLQAQYSILDIGHAGDSMAVGVTVGYNFLKF